MANLIELEIVPRLLAAHRPTTIEAPRRRPGSEGFGATAAAFAPMVLDRDAFVLLQHVENLIDRGIAIDTILIDLIAPTARQLGLYWEEDRCDFVDVTMGLWRLQELVHELAARLPQEPLHHVGRNALLAVMPGDQHSLGVVMVEEFFRNAGWSTSRVLEGDEEHLIDSLAAAPIDVVGLSISAEQDLDRAGLLIAALRKAARNPDLLVMAGGRLLTERPELAIAIGADATAADARQAVARAETLLHMRAAATATL